MNLPASRASRAATATPARLVAARQAARQSPWGQRCLFRTAEEFYVLRAMGSIVLQFECALELAQLVQSELDGDCAASAVSRYCAARAGAHVDWRSGCRSRRERDRRRTEIDQCDALRGTEGVN